VPIGYEIDEERGLVVVLASGEVTRDEETRRFAALLADPRYRPGLHLLLDYRARSSVASPSEVHRMAEDLKGLRDLLGDALCALVVSTDVAFGTGRMVAALTEGTFVPLRVFRDRDEALDWLRSDGAAENRGA
jgi:hypothetical protein